ncbi:RNA-binding protein [Natronomonas sp. CBA1123]|jgi:RNA-binding protein|uniref:YhbY family RNA-binding protein n=1 Tax=Natronomonas TaxID=63743 RepID=UPI0012EAA51E|nr:MULTISPECIES: YhbY family RNA-binding protein [Natronomonas]MUV88063.1 RNA-binding protein [Natronomonas sp. CBA1123]
MSEQDLRQRAHDVEVTVWVGKGGLDPVVEELSDQLQERDLVKAKFLRAARGGTTTEELAEDLAERVNGEVIETRGHTAVFHR